MKDPKDNDSDEDDPISVVIHVLLWNLSVSKPMKMSSCSYFDSPENLDERNNSADQSSVFFIADLLFKKLGKLDMNYQL